MIPDSTPAVSIAVGIDTHADINVAAVIDQVGRQLGHASFDTTPAGHRQLEAWARSHGEIGIVGIEGTGVYGAGICAHLRASGARVVEVDRPDRKSRRFEGKSDPIDAYAAARAALSGRASGVPKTRDGNVEMIRVLRVARTSAIKARADRIGTSAKFAMLCGVAPIPATSGKTTNRHRLNRGGDRGANAALYRIAMCRLRYDERTRAYRDRLRSQGKTTKEAIRIIKRAIAREVYQAITTDLTTTPETT